MLQSFLKYFRRYRTQGPAGTDLITATPRRLWSGRPLKRATIEIDRESKAIRKLTLERQFAGQEPCVITITLVESRLGGQTTQAVSGQAYPLVGKRLTDNRISAAIVMSPSAPDRGNIDQAFGSVSIPWMMMTGTLDSAAVGTQTPESRRRVFPALSSGDKFELVLNRAEHSAFTDRALPGDKEQRNPNHHRVILALSTAFWDAYLKDDATAKAWLTGEGTQAVLEPSDIWMKK